LAKYIQNKNVNDVKVNDLIDFDGIGDAIWNFILAVYVAKWDALFTDQKTNTFRNKISSKFTPRTPLLSLLSLPVKSKKEINTISKYF